MHSNRLAKEKSPYLLQHAHNPVDWYPWGREAFDRAKKEDRPVFLSIGYSTCHWCHVMARESFEDAEVARLMNDSFVCIKVDREERPDIDNIYMSICQMMSGSCGWPLNILLTPDRKPFLTATYIPKEGRPGQPGMLELIPKINGLWKERRSEVNDLAEGIQSALKRKPEGPRGEEPGGETLKLAYDLLSASFDEANGGFGTAPKFPSPHNLQFLLRHWKRTGDKRTLQLVERTLQAMRLGGIMDQVGMGFHRYSTDAEWLVPHFEKMLYDQAMLALAYTEAFQATRQDEYASVARHTLDYVLRELRSPEGAFLSAEDADTEGDEGKFYLWTEQELREALGEEDASLAIKVFGVTKQGNFTDALTGHRNGQNILHMKATEGEAASVLKMEVPGLEKRLDVIRGRLFEARSKRPAPRKDDKVLADWNGLMIAALARAAQALDDEGYGKAARRTADFTLKNMRRDGRLLHRYRDGDASIQANLDDLAFLVWGLLELYEYGLDPSILKAALELNESMLVHFWDKDGGGLFFSPDDGEELLIRQKEVYDGALPSGNSVAALNLIRLARITGEAALEKRARELMRAFSAEVTSFPLAHTNMMLAVDYALGPSHEVVIVGEEGSADTIAMLKALRSRFLPGTVLVFRPAGEKGQSIVEVAPFIREMKALDGKATAYVCSKGSCKQPVTDVNRMLELLGAPPTG